MTTTAVRRKRNRSLTQCAFGSATNIRLACNGAANDSKRSLGPKIRRAQRIASHRWRATKRVSTCADCKTKLSERGRASRQEEPRPGGGFQSGPPSLELRSFTDGCFHLRAYPNREL